MLTKWRRGNKATDDLVVVMELEFSARRKSSTTGYRRNRNWKCVKEFVMKPKHLVPIFPTSFYGRKYRRLDVALQDDATATIEHELDTVIIPPDADPQTDEEELDKNNLEVVKYIFSIVVIGEIELQHINRSNEKESEDEDSLSLFKRLNNLQSKRTKKISQKWTKNIVDTMKLETRNSVIFEQSKRANHGFNASDFDPYITDENSDYEPPSVPHLNVNQSQHVNELLENNTSDSAHVTPKRTRKKRLNIKGHKKQIRKNARLQGLEYETAKGKKVMQKELKVYEHRCRYKCHEINEADRQMLFTRFYQLKSYDLQTNFIASYISKIAPKRKIAQAVSHKQFSTIIKLMGVRVCKPFFLKTLDITTRRFLIVGNKKTDEGFIETDQRGRFSPINKISDVVRDDVTHIKMFPRYRSHYSRLDNRCSRCLPENLNVSKMYSLYSDWCTEKNKAKVKESYYRHIFATEFNLKFYRPHSDTCHTCDKLNNMSISDDSDATETWTPINHNNGCNKIESSEENISLSAAHILIRQKMDKGNQTETNTEIPGNVPVIDNETYADLHFRDQNKTRKQKSNTTRWKSAQAKDNRNYGKSYTNSKGNQVASRSIKSPCNEEKFSVD
ncbi:unnamed protein product [Diabrotica balteata]|uniref:Uncharacterized protein n=1 Tax=Diabrotica balteata TaxID=107213 RepID=A0A9N9XC11_DIABA|nr:unnamed protein product [Diabrotica balteata]